MLRHFFNRNSKLVRVIEVIGGIGFAIILISEKVGIIFILYLLSYLFIRACAIFNWYKKFGIKDDEAGIRLHFKKALVPTSYIIAITNWAFIAGLKVIPVFVALAFLLFMTHVHIILIYLHLRDKEDVPPNFLSGRG